MLTDSLIKRLMALESWRPPDGVEYEIRLRPDTDELDIHLTCCPCVSFQMSIPAIPTGEFLELLTQEAESMIAMLEPECTCHLEKFTIDTSGYGRDEPEPVIALECGLCDAAYSGTIGGAISLGWTHVGINEELSTGEYVGCCPDPKCTADARVGLGL